MNWMPPDDERVSLWIAGYRRLMRGGLSNIVHSAGTSVSMTPDGPASLKLSDVVGLIGQRDSARAAAQALEEENARLTAALERIRGLHPPGANGRCSECFRWWPCGSHSHADAALEARR